MAHIERQAKDLAAKGVKITTSTLANWVIYAANVFLKPLYAKMKSELLGNAVIHADETVVQFLREPGRKAKTASRMWVYCSEKYKKYRSILFEYQQTRNGNHAKRFLGDFPDISFATASMATTSCLPLKDAIAIRTAP